MKYSSTIGVNGTILTEGRKDGWGRVTYETIKTLTIKYGKIKVYGNLKIGAYGQIPVPKIFSRGTFISDLLRLYWHQTHLAHSIKKHGIDLYYSPNIDGMMKPPCPQIFTIFDLIPMFYPDCAPKLQYYYKYIIPRLLRASTYTIAGSVSTKKDIERMYPGKGRIEVIYPGYSKEKFRPQKRKAIEDVRRKFGLSEYFLCVNEVRTYKNNRKMIEAFSLLKSTAVQLAIVGRISKQERDIVAETEEYNKSGNIRFLGTVSDEDLAALYAGAVAFVFPSLYEGFGLPPLEAMAVGCPVIASNRSSIPEVCDSAAFYFDPSDIHEMAAAMGNVIGSKKIRDNLTNSGLKQAQRFSYDKTADHLLQLFKRIL